MVKLKEIVRYGIVGGTSVIIHYGVYYLLMNFIYVNIAFTIGFLLAFIYNFFLSAHFTFKSKPSLKKGFGFGLSHFINYTLQISLLNVFLWLGISKEIAPIPVFCITFPLNFLLVRFVFKSRYFQRSIDMKQKKNCQSCGMPLSNDPRGGGLNMDGSKSELYCSFCYHNGQFTFNGSLKEFQEYCRVKMIEGGMPKFIAWLFSKSIRNLDRWKKQ